MTFNAIDDELVGRLYDVTNDKQKTLQIFRFFRDDDCKKNMIMYLKSNSDLAYSDLVKDAYLIARNKYKE